MKSIETPEKEIKTKTLKESKLHKYLTAGHPHLCPKKNKTNMTDRLVKLNLTPPSQEEGLLPALVPVRLHLGCLLPANGLAH